MLVVDTNILFSFAVDNDWSDQVRALYRKDAVWHSEAHAMVEVTNVLVRYVRNRLMSDAEALAALDSIEALLEGNIHVAEHRHAYRTARDLKVSAYDARFLVAAQSFGTRLVTEDAKLRRAAPQLTQSLDEALVAA